MGRAEGPSRMVEDAAAPLSADVLVIGGGQNGLSLAAALGAEGVTSCIVLEARARVGDQWRERYQRLHLHHITDAMALPGAPWPAAVPRYASRLDVADYLAAYAALHRVDVRPRHRVLRLSERAAGDGAARWRAEVEAADPAGGPPRRLTFTAAHVVLAAGGTGVDPLVPRLKVRGAEGEEGGEWGGRVMHSSAYFSADGMRGERVLLVGSGNSAVEICVDLHDHGARPSLLVRGPNTYVTREGFALYHRALQYGGRIAETVPGAFLLAPLVMHGLDRWFPLQVRMRYGDLSAKGIVHHPSPPMWRLFKTGRAPTYVDGTWGKVGVSVLDLIRSGDVPTHTAEIDHLVAGTRAVAFRDGTRAEFDRIILATGFEPIFSHYRTFVDPPVLKKMLAGFNGGVLGGLRREADGLPGLWACIGGFVGTRHGQVILAKRIAARLGRGSGPGVVARGAAMFALAGLDPGELRVSPQAVAVNAAAAAAIAARLLRSRL